MVELKWIRTGCTIELFYRLGFGVDASGALCPGEPGEWVKVPVEPSDAPDHEGGCYVGVNNALDTPAPE